MEIQQLEINTVFTEEVLTCAEDQSSCFWKPPLTNDLLPNVWHKHTIQARQHASP